MPKQDPQQLLQSIKQAHTEAKRAKNGVVQYEKTAQKKTNAIDKLLTAGKQKLETTVLDIKTHFTKDAQGFKDAAKTEAEAVEAIRKEAKDHYNRFNRTYAAATNKRSGIEAKHVKISQLTDQSTANANEISKNLTKTNNAKTAITELLQNSRKNDKEIASIHTEAERVNQEIQNTYGITLDTTMAGTLVDRRNALQKRTKIWEYLYLSSIGVIVAAILIALLVSKPRTFVEVITERLVFVTPLVVVAFVLGKQYGHERKLYEEYAFKAAAAQSLRGYTVLLNSEFRDIQEARLDILKFTIGAMEGIYDREPLIQNPSTLHVMFGNDFAKFEAKIEEKIHKAADEAARTAIKEVKNAKETVEAV